MVEFGYNVSEMINEWGAYAGVLPQTITGGFSTKGKPSNGITEIVGPELKQVTKHLDRWGSSLAIETFASFDIWAEQSASTSLMSYGDGR